MTHTLTDFSLGSTITPKGVVFRVWAPFATKAAVLLDESFEWIETPLEPTDGGIWQGFVADVAPGRTYKYRLTTENGAVLERNDPRARQLTVSDNGHSVVADPEFDWEDVERPVIEKNKQIIYELHVGTFNRPDASTSGTFATVIEKLPYLKDLGVTTIELMPVTSMATSNGWGYAPNHLFSVENTYGGRHGLLTLIKECHKAGLGIIVDVVYNHFAADTDLWRFDGWSEADGGGIYFYNDARGHTPWGGRPDYGRAEVRDFILDNVTMWFTEFHIDGLRVDSTTYMRGIDGPDSTADRVIPEAWALLQAVTERAHKINPHALLIAEDTSGEPAVTRPVSEGGAGFDAQWALGFPHAIRDMLGLNDTAQDDQLLSHLAFADDDCAFTGVVFSDSHDTAANGSVRLNEAVAPGNAATVDARQQALLASAITLTVPNIPMVLQGQEFLQAGAFNDWQLLEWPKTDQFAGIVMAHQHLMQLRLDAYGNTAGLTGDSIETFHYNGDDHVIAFHRWQHGGPLDSTVVVINCRSDPYDTYDLHFPTPGTWQVRFDSAWRGYSKDFVGNENSSVETDEQGNGSIKLAGYGVAIFSQEA